MYSNGEGQHGNAMVDFNELLKAYHINSFEELINDFKSRYENDEKSWTKIIKEMKAKGLDVNDDEDESMNY